jgi:arylsulfatase A-like enzyme
MLATVSSNAAIARRLRSLSGAVAELPPYPAAVLLACTLLCVAEDALLPGPRTFDQPFYLLGLIAPFALIAGTGWQLVLLAGKRTGRAVYALWPALALTATLSLAQRVSAFAQLGGSYDQLARQTIAGSTLAGLLLGATLSLMQPTRRHPEGWIAARGAGARALAALVLSGAAAALAVADQLVYLGLYPEVHLALRLCALLALTLALINLAPPVPLPRVSASGATLALVLLLLPLIGLRESQIDTIEALLSRPFSALLLRGGRAAFDLDRDGFAWVLGGGDCNDLDARINPTAREIPDNGVDDNCAFGDRGRKRSAARAVPPPSAPSPRSVVLITIDTLRWDRLGSNDPAFGPRGRDTMPELTRWSERAVRFSHAYTPGTWTSIALGSALRGLYPRRLSFMPYYETTAYRLLQPPLDRKLAAGELPAHMFPLAFSDPHPSIAEWLKRRGMQTIAVVDDGFSQMLSPELGTARGFDAYREVNGYRKKKRRRRDDAKTADMAIAELQAVEGGAKFFLWVHLFGPHAPNKTHAGIKTYGTSMSDGYDHEVRFVDAQLGRILAAIDALPEPPAVFVTADHGEEFYGTYRTHGTDLSEPVLRVPLVARVPGWPPRVVAAPVSLVDLAPTIFALTETPPPDELDGVDLAPLARGEPAHARVLFSDVWRYGALGSAFTDMSGAYDGERKVVLNRLDHSWSVQRQLRGSAPLSAADARADALTRRLLAYLEEGNGPIESGARAAQPR